MGCCWPSAAWKAPQPSSRSCGSASTSQTARSRIPQSRARCRCRARREENGMRANRGVSTGALELDALDRDIIEALRADGRASNSAVAARLGVAEGTIRQRVKKLLDT